MAVSGHFTDWSYIQSFLAVAETGSLSAAAAKLGQSQPTIGRHIKALEDTLGVELFHRHARGLSLTDIGQDMHPMAETMRTAMATIALKAEAHSSTSTGIVRIASSDFMAHHVLPPILARMRQDHPAIHLVVIPSDSSENLLFRQADIAIRMFRPDQLELVTRHVADIEMGIFAASEYLERRGRPQKPEDLLNHDLVGYDQSTLITDAMHAMGWQGTPEHFALRCDHHPTYWEMVRAGGGIGFTQAHVGRDDPLVEELTLGLPIPSLPIWLTAHQTVRKAPRVDAIWRALDSHLTAKFA